MKEFLINGRLIVDDHVKHEELIYTLFDLLKESGIHFAGTTKEIKQIHKSNSLIS